jgi:hypothetical protein
MHPRVSSYVISSSSNYSLLQIKMGILFLAFLKMRETLILTRGWNHQGHEFIKIVTLTRNILSYPPRSNL